MKFRGFLPFVLLVTLFSISSLFGAGTLPVQEEEPTLALIAPTETQSVTEPVDVEVQVSNVINLAAFEFDLIYDPTLVQVNGITAGDFLGETTDCDPDAARCVVTLGPLDQNGAAGLGTYTYGTGPGVTGDGVVATIHLHPTGINGTTPLGIANAQIADAAANPMAPVTVETTLTLGPPPYLIYLPLVARQTDADNSIAVISATTSAFSTEATALGPVASPACPDFDSDGMVDTVDVFATADQWRLEPGDQGWDEQFDLDVDGKITIVDITKVAAAWGSQCQDLPPDPAGVAPDLDLTQITCLEEATAFLYTGNNPIQTGVDPDALDCKRGAILRGRALTRDGQPLPGVTITIHDRLEYGQTLSRADGMFDMAVNGGTVLVVNYQKEGYLPAQRKLYVPWQNYAWLPDVVLIPLDPKVTTVDLTSSDPIQIAQGSVISDTDGTRQATLLVPQGTQAELILPGGITQTLTSLDVRATEYTVGDSGPQAMPGELPSQSGYTYAIEYSVDEALDAGAMTVRFSQPLIHYVENFLGFPVGMPVPMGYYDRERATWVPADNGLVIEILSIDNGLAELDIDGSGSSADAQALANLGITDGEREQLANLYQPGQSLWRVPITHFTPWDCNWPYGPPDDATPPNGDQPAGDDLLDEPCRAEGSIIECQNQVLGEVIDIVGTPFSLHYSSDRVLGRSPALKIPLSGDTIPDSLKSIELEVEIAGQLFSESFPALPNQSYTFVWDRKDAYGRTLQGVQPATIRIGYVYDAVYQEPADFDRAFAAFSGVPITGSRARQDITIWQVWQRSLSRWNAQAQGLGGWSLDVHHIYDPASRQFYLGNSQRRSGQHLSSIIITVAGQGTFGDSGDGGPASEAQLSHPQGIAAGPDGSLYIADQFNHRIRRVWPDGIITTVAGTGSSSGPFGDGGPATEATLAYPKDVALGPDGSLYIVTGQRIRRVDPDGFISTVAGTGLTGYGGDGGPATEALLSLSGNFPIPAGVTVGPDNSFYIADVGNNRIRRVGPDGIITTVAGNGVFGYSGDGGPAMIAQLAAPTGVAVGPDGSLYIADRSNHSIRRVGVDGIITTVAGGTFGFSGDGGLASEASLRRPSDVIVGPDGSLYIADDDNSRIRHVAVDGIITTIAGNGSLLDPEDNGGPAKQAAFWDPQDLALGPDGNLYIAERGSPSWSNNRIRSVQSLLPGLSLSDIFIPAADGNEIYVFSGRGRHLRTLDALTGAIRHQFSYDSAGLLTEVTDVDGNTTIIERDIDGNPTAIVGPYSQRTALTIDSNGYLASIANPVGETHQLNYTEDGLLTSLTDPRGHVYDFSFDDLGRLTQDDNPTGSSQTLVRTDDNAGYEVARTTVLSRTSTYRVESLTPGDQRQINTFPDGSQAEKVIGTDGSRTTTLPDGAVSELLEGPDPRWGMLAPLPNSLSLSTPGGLAKAIISQRSANLAEPGNLMSLTVQTDTVSINGRFYTSIYDAADRTLTDSTPMGRQSTTTVDAFGRVVETQASNFAPVSYAYDDRGRLTSYSQTADSETRSMAFSYSDDGYLDVITDTLGHVVSFAYDQAGRVTDLTLPDGRIARYTFDANGNVTSITPPGRPAHSFSYSADDLLETYMPPDVGFDDNTTSYIYNADRQLTRITRPGDRQIDYGYDDGGRLETVTLERGTVSYDYDPTTANLTAITTPDGGTLSFARDGSLPTQTTWSGQVSGSVGRTYDNDFRITSLSVNGDSIAFQYDEDNLLTDAGDLSLSYDVQNGKLISTTLDNVSDSRSHNVFGDPMGYTATYSDTLLFDVAYARDQLGRITEKSETVAGVTTTYSYTYDLAGRLIEVWEDGSLSTTYAYDDNGNRLSYTGSGGTVNGSYDDQDRLLLYGTTVYTYTANGEVLTKTVGGQVTNYQYDELGNLIAVTLPDGLQIEYIIDGKNRRIGKRVDGNFVQGFLYQDGLNPIAELDSNGNVISRFVYGDRANVPAYLIRGGTTYRIVADHLGSPRLIVNATTGDIVQRIDYDEFGNITLDTNPGFQPFGFSGGLYDPDTRLVRFGARDYAPDIGRWTAKDPMGFLGGENMYTYVDNDPVQFVDPHGRFTIGSIAKWLARKIAEWFIQGELQKREGPGSPFDDELNAGEDEDLARVNRDIDGDGISDYFDTDDDDDDIPDEIDPDRDGDGIDNEFDREPEIPLIPLEIIREFEEIQKEKEGELVCPN